jgi:hypothetical protein
MMGENMECKVEQRARGTAGSGHSGHDRTDTDMADFVLYTSHHQCFPFLLLSSEPSPASLFHFTFAHPCYPPLSLLTHNEWYLSSESLQTRSVHTDPRGGICAKSCAVLLCSLTEPVSSRCCVHQD